MSSSINVAFLLGNLGNDPDAIKGGIAFRLATSRRWTDNKGRKQERTDWHRCVVFGGRGEALAKLLHKGSRAHVTGEIQTSEYQDKDSGEKRYSTDIIASDVVLLDPAPEGRQGRRNAPRDEADDAPGGMQ